MTQSVVPTPHAHTFKWHPKRRLQPLRSCFNAIAKGGGGGPASQTEESPTIIFTLSQRNWWCPVQFTDNRNWWGCRTSINLPLIAIRFKLVHFWGVTHNLRERVESRPERIFGSSRISVPRRRRRRRGRAVGGRLKDSAPQLFTEYSKLRFREWKHPSHHHPLTGWRSGWTRIRAAVAMQEWNHLVTGCEISYFCIKRKSISLPESEWTGNWLENLKYLSRRGISFHLFLSLEFSGWLFKRGGWIVIVETLPLGSIIIIGGLPVADKLNRQNYLTIGKEEVRSGKCSYYYIVQIGSESSPITSSKDQ